MSPYNRRQAVTETDRRYPVWVHRLVFPFRFGKLVAGLLIFLLMWTLLSVGSSEGELRFYVKLFFTATMAYIVPVFSHIVERTVAVFDEIQPQLDASAEDCARWRRTLTHRSGRWYMVVSISALVMGSGNLALEEPAGGMGIWEDILSGQGDYATYLAILVLWVTLTTAITALLSNATLFARLGRHYLRIDLLHSPAILAIARIAVMSTLSIIGAQVLFVILILDADVDWLTIVPGFATMTTPVLALFLIPVWPLRKRLQAARRAELAMINSRLEQLRPGAVTALDDRDALDQVNRLLLYRREIEQVSEWPFDMPALTRLGLYLILPPLTWVGAALIENLVDAVL